MKIAGRRILTFGLAAVLQLGVFFLLLTYLHDFASVIGILLLLYSVFALMHILARYEESTYKILWLVTLLTFPILGAALYFLYGEKRAGKRLRKRMKGAEKMLTFPQMETASGACLALGQRRKRLSLLLASMEKTTGFPVRENTYARYYPIGEQLYEKMLEEMEKARHFIYCEYFIINHGKMWDQMEEIMTRKAREGVVVRIMYDDLGSLGTFSPDEVERLAAKGLHCVRFNPIRFFTGSLNYRDHRKMLIIDGVSSFSGGVNLADEYINEEVRFGHWKDVGFHLTGSAVENYTRMFVLFWESITAEKLPEEEYMLSGNAGERSPASVGDKAAEAYPASEESPATAGGEDKADGYVFSYYDSPLKEACISNSIYMDLLYQAKEYIWFYTPYLLPGDVLLDAMVKAAERGVDVRIVTPGIPDKKMVFRMTRSYYKPLMQAGVKIYEYTPGFVHAKGCVMDGEVATVGTVNLDYRSLFLHYENNSLFADASLVTQVREDMEETMALCRLQTDEDVKRSFWGEMRDGFLRIIAPLC